MSATEPVRLARSQIDELGDVLARAFYDDPAYVYVIPTGARRARLLAWSMRAIVRYGFHYGEIYTTAEKVAGGALWLPPGESRVNPWRMLRVLSLSWLLQIDPRDLGRFLEFMQIDRRAERYHTTVVPARHWYLMILGVDPSRQGQGVGSALIQRILARADAEGLPCYLETWKARNVAFYQKHGFEVAVEDQVPGGGPLFWTMRREPRR